MPQSDFWPFSKVKQGDNIGLDGKSLLLQKQLGDMEGEVKEIEMELAAIRRNRQDIKANPLVTVVESEEIKKEPMSFEPYNKYDDDQFNFKQDNEIGKLREDLIRAKTTAEEERFQRIKYEARLKDLELKLNDICTAGKATDLRESRKITTDEVAGLNAQVRDLKEYIEELKITDDEKSEQLQEYRVKYLQAQQNVEELRRQMDEMEFENKQASDQIQMELHKMKVQFQEKLLELAPLPDLLKGAQIQLQEAKQLQKLAEDNTLQISNELHRNKEKLLVAVNNLNQEKIYKSKLIEENNLNKTELVEKQNEIQELTKHIEDYKCQTLRLEEKLAQLQTRYNEKAAEHSSMLRKIEELKDESTRALTRSKERAESTKHYLQTQISELERQMVTCRAQSRSYQKERDETRQRTQIQISNLKESFDMMEVRLRGLQRQVTLLKHCYSAALPEDEEGGADCEATAYVQSM